MSELKSRHAVGVGAAACAVCCAVPLLALVGIGVTGIAATIVSLMFAGVAFAVVVALAAAGTALVARRRRRTHPTTCGDNCTCGDTLGVPTWSRVR